MRADRPISEGSPGQLRNLQLLRAVAAFAVVLQHAIHDSLSLGGEPSQEEAIRHLPNMGFGVDIFFVISGFIMAHTMAAEFGKPGAPKRFLLRRLARIVPLYWLLTTVLILGSVVAPGLLNVPIGDLWHAVASYLFIPDSRVTGEVRPILALGWTLDFEMFFYVLFAVALALPIRRGIFWLSLVMVSLAVFHVVARPTSAPMAFWTNPIILEFLFGIAIALAFRSGFRITPAPSFVLAAAGMVGFALVLPYADESEFMLRFMVTGVLAALLVLAAALGPSIAEKPALAFGVALGDASYSLYLVHPFVVRPLRALWHHVLGERLPAIFYVAACCLASIAVALVIHKVLERPLTRLIQNRIRAHERAALPRADALVASRLQP